jgi:hypothetical protein
MQHAIEEILDFVTSSPSLEEIVSFTYSDETLERVSYLSEQETTNALTSEEINELREFKRAAHVMEQLKIRAQRRLGKPLDDAW